jgi:hypothetical protein
MARPMSKLSPQPPVAQTGRILTLAFGALVVLGIIALIALSFTRQNAPSAVNATASPQAPPSPPPTPVETPGIHFKSQGHPGHDKKDPSEVVSFAYNSDPPTSGMHLERFSDALINQAPLPKYMQVHLLEHGNVLLQYSCTNCPDIAGALAQIASIYNNRQLPEGQTVFTPDLVQTIEERGSGVIVAPYPGMKHKIALTAWTRLEPFETIDEPAMIKFINAYLTNQANAMQ